MPKGFLPVYRVGDEEEAQALIVGSCPLDDSGAYYARELAEEQTLENLELFSTRLDTVHDRIAAAGRCRCGVPPKEHRKDIAAKRGKR